MVRALSSALSAAVLIAAFAAPVQAQSAATPPIALSCGGCHGVDGSGAGGVPGIAGVPRETFLATWAAFRADQRPATIMNRIARGYTDAEVEALAAYFASLR